MIPEFVGRLPVVAVVDPLGPDELRRVLVEPKNAIVKQYQRMFEMEGAMLQFTDEALTEIAAQALKRKTGVRALRSIIEGLLRETAFTLPETGAGREFTITPEIARGEKPLQAEEAAAPARRGRARGDSARRGSEASGVGSRGLGGGAAERTARPGRDADAPRLRGIGQRTVLELRARTERSRPVALAQPLTPASTARASVILAAMPLPRITELTLADAARTSPTRAGLAAVSRRPALRVGDEARRARPREDERPARRRSAPGSARPTTCARPGSSAARPTRARRPRRCSLEVGPGEAVEAVLINEGDRSTICLSTQVGCPVRCGFCASGLFGLKRNLTRGEILEQFLELVGTAARKAGRRITNVVVMGMGEPMMNVKSLLEALAIINDPTGPHLGARHITVSTSGSGRASISSCRRPASTRSRSASTRPNDALRAQIVPFAAAMPVAEMVDAAQEYLARKGREVTFEYVLLDGVNASARPRRASSSACSAASRRRRT